MSKARPSVGHGQQQAHHLSENCVCNVSQSALQEMQLRGFGRLACTDIHDDNENVRAMASHDQRSFQECVCGP